MSSAAWTRLPRITWPRRTALNYDPNATVNSGCLFTILGCTNASASNFEAVANADDGSCVFARLGCIDADALNFDSLAEFQGGACVFPQTGL